MVTKNWQLKLVLLVVAFFLFVPEADAATISKPMHNLGLVGYWSFDVGKGGSSARDMSGQGNHGTLTNMNTATAWVDGKLGQALSFDGVNDYIQVGDPASLNISGNITVSAWVSFSVSQTNRPIVSRWGTDQSYALLVPSLPANVLSFCIRVADVNKCAASTKTYNDGLWHHVVGRFNGSNALLTIDGGVESIVGDATTGPIDTPATNVVIGDYNTPGGQFKGKIDDVRIYNRALSADEIKRLYNMGR